MREESPDRLKRKSSQPVVAKLVFCTCVIMANCTEVQYVPQQWFGNGEPNLRGECSGNGQCVEAIGRCICDDGWTGNADFFGDTGTDCQINILGIQIEYGLLLAITLFSWYKQYPGLKKRYHDYVKAKQAAQAKGKSYSVIQNRGVVTMIIWNSVGAPSIIATCIIRMASTTERVGVTVLLTFFFMMVKNIFYLSSLLYQPYLFKTLLKGERMNNSANGAAFLHFVNITSAIGFTISVAASFIPFISVADPSLAGETFIAYYISQFLTLFYNGYIAIAIYFKAEKLFGASYSMNKDEKILNTKIKMKGFQRAVFLNTTFFGLTYVIFLIWPFWWNLHDYFVAITWLVFIKVANDIALGTNEKKEKATKEPSSGGELLTDHVGEDTEPEGQSMSV